MIELLHDLPERVVGVKASGHVTAADYETVLIPAIESQIKTRGTARILYQIGPEFSDFTAGAMWDDAKLGLQHLRHWERVAVVTDVDWVASAVRLFRFVVPGMVRVFSNAQYADAAAWVAA